MIAARESPHDDLFALPLRHYGRASGIHHEEGIAFLARLHHRLAQRIAREREGAGQFLQLRGAEERKDANGFQQLFELLVHFACVHRPRFPQSAILAESESALCRGM